MTRSHTHGNGEKEDTCKAFKQKQLGLMKKKENTFVAEIEQAKEEQHMVTYISRQEETHTDYNVLKI